MILDETTWNICLMSPIRTPQTILVLGAGELGSAVLRHLAQQADVAAGDSICVLLRSSRIDSSDPARQAQLMELDRLGIGVVTGDLVNDSIDFLASIFVRFTTVVSCIGFSAGPGVQIRLTRAAIQAGVNRYVPWQFGVDYDIIGRGSAQPVFDEQLDVRDLLRNQEQTNWILISTGMFTSFLFEPSFGVVDLERGFVRALGSWDTEVTVTTPEDIGYLTARILFFEPRINNEVVFTAGETLDYCQLADRLDDALSRQFERVVWTRTALDEALCSHPDGQIERYRAVFAAGRGVAWPKEQTFNYRLGIPTAGVGDWIETNLSGQAFGRILTVDGPAD